PLGNPLAPVGKTGSHLLLRQTLPLPNGTLPQFFQRHDGKAVFLRDDLRRLIRPSQIAGVNRIKNLGFEAFGQPLRLDETFGAEGSVPMTLKPSFPVPGRFTMANQIHVGLHRFSLLFLPRAKAAFSPHPMKAKELQSHFTTGIRGNPSIAPVPSVPR